MSAQFHQAIGKLKKLPTMGSQEILFRIGGERAKCVERIAYRMGWFDWSSSKWCQHLSTVDDEYMCGVCLRHEATGVQHQGVIGGCMVCFYFC